MRFAQLLIRSVLVSLFVGLALNLAAKPTVYAASIEVNDRQDILTSGDGKCTLREAIINANIDRDTTGGDCEAGNGPDDIFLFAGTYRLTIAGSREDASATGDLDITNDLTITGEGADVTILDGAGLDRVLHIVSGSVKLADITIQNGNGEAGGGIANEGFLALRDCVIRNNTSSLNGGGIFNDRGEVEIQNSTIASNTANDGGGIYNDESGIVKVFDSDISGNDVSSGNVGQRGGGIFNDQNGEVKVENSYISENSAGVGGGIFNSGILIITLSRIFGNSVAGDITGDGGGGLKNVADGVVGITRSEISGNFASSQGGGIDNEGIMIITNSTISENSAFTNGGGINNSNGTVELNHVTIAYNIASRGDGGGIFNRASGQVNIKNSILAGNNDGSPPIARDCSGKIRSRDYNILEHKDVCTFIFGLNDTEVDPMLDRLRSNGGPTYTHALLLGSPAKDTVPFINCTTIAGDPVTNDQRGVERPQGSACDIGAFEAQITTLGKSSFYLPQDGIPNNNGFIGPFCCTGRTAIVRTVDGDPVGYIYFFSWQGQARNLGDRSIAPDIEILVSGVLDLNSPNAPHQESSVPFAAHEMRVGATRSMQAGALNYRVTIEAVETVQFQGKTYFYMDSVEVRVDVSIP